ncbi:Facilitated trehalose transporter Tret1 [Plutella xylostella]|uniref:Facilitated trehalose transporter Tret1 n=1 Tax=Plutella xylostella TaxID=51655 RepID=A0ABQ7R0B1_PLUXY|nr:Facilitated trehalose transporter Tret1 [Plutella xylostella]
MFDKLQKVGDAANKYKDELPDFENQVLAAVAVSLGSMIVGFSSAYTSPALVTMENSTYISVTKEQASWVGGLMPLAALAGGIIGGPLVDYIGRRRTILFTAPPFLVGWILIGSASVVHLVLAGRAICGLCVGIGSLAFPVYLGETIQPEVRGTLGLFPTAIGNIGILVCYVAGKYLDWAQLAYLGAALPIPFFILMMMIPETPRWYVSNGRTDEARKALQWLRGKSTNIDEEMRDIALIDSEISSNESTITEVFSRIYMKSILTCIGLMAFQQLSGINAVIFYTVQIFQMSGSSVDEHLSTIIVGVVNFASTFIATAIIDRVGRKILLYFSSVTMTLTLILLGTFFYVRDVYKMDVSSLGWLPLTSVMLYLLGFSLGFGPIPWLMMGEILPAKIRGPAASICTAFNWLCTFTVTKTFQNILDGIGPCGTFWLFGCICFVGLFFVIIFVPETRGKSLEQIESKLTGRAAPAGRTRRLSSIAHIKPLPSGC